MKWLTSQSMLLKKESNFTMQYEVWNIFYNLDKFTTLKWIKNVLPLWVMPDLHLYWSWYNTYNRKTENHFRKYNTTQGSTFFKMEDDLHIFEKEAGPQVFSNGRRPQLFCTLNIKKMSVLILKGCHKSILLYYYLLKIGF